jgi:DNA helicase II / ATP-dependent DNA helicase PcrA
MLEKLSETLTASQRAAVFHKDGPLLVIAGPGSGKTRVITCRIAALIASGVRPYNICAITFTNKAAEEMRNRSMTILRTQNSEPRTHNWGFHPYISTFHSLCVRILRQYSEQADIKANFSIYDDADQSNCIKQAVKDCGLDATNFSPARMLDAISTLKNKLTDPVSFKSQADDFFSVKLADVYEAYQKILAERSALDFDDLLMKTAFLLRDCPQVCRELGERFQYLLIDEYQDTNNAQYSIARSLVSLHNNICATGDPDQSIYRWRGADIRNIMSFEKDWPAAQVVKLEENFRSAANILTMADGLIACNRNRKQKRLIPTKPASAEVCIWVCEDQNDEAQKIADQIKSLNKKGSLFRNMAVFYRVNAMSRVLEEAFIRNKIPYQIVRGVEFYHRKEIRDLMGYLKILVNPDDQVALLRILNTPARGIGKTTADKIKDYASEKGIGFYNALKDVEHIESLSNAAKAKIAVFIQMIEQFRQNISGEVSKLIERVFTESGLSDSLRASGTEGQNAIENIEELINSAAEYDKQNQPETNQEGTNQAGSVGSLIDYLQQISLFSDADAYDSGSDCVAMMSLHAAKGLEFDNVFIAGVEEGLLPHERTNLMKDDDELEEERRLLFVGITRAKAGLHISYARYRNIRGQTLRSIPSRFLFELGCGFTEPDYESQTRDDGRWTMDDGRAASSEPQTARTEPRATSQVSLFKTGQIVRHKTFGIGQVKTLVDMGTDSIVEVRFNTGQTKSLLLKYANLEKINR